MANKISITIAVKNQATKPLKDVGKSVKGLSNDIKNFNRDLFATTALIGTFAVGFKKALDISKVGAQYDYFRTQFYSVFGPEYFRTLQQATRGTVDAMALMEESVKAYRLGFSKEETKQAFGISVWAAKTLSISTKDAMKQIIQSLNSGRMEFMNMLAPSLKWSDRFQMINKVIGQTGKGFIGAGLKGKVFRKMLLEEMYIASQKAAGSIDDLQEVSMRVGAAFTSLKQTVGDLIARALTPLSRIVGDRVWGAFAKLDEIIGAVDVKTRNVREGLVDLIKSIGFSLSALTTFWGSFKVLSMILGTLGMPLKTFIGAVMLVSTVIKAAKADNEDWLTFLSKVGTAFKFLYEALITYKDGWIHISGDVYNRFKTLTPATRDFLLNVSQGLAVLKEGILGVVHGFSLMFNAVAKGLRWLGMFDGKTNQLNKGWATFAKSVGTVVGVLGALYGVKLAAGAALKIPGAVGGFFKKNLGQTPLNPMYVYDVAKGGIGKVGGMLDAGKGALGWLLSGGILSSIIAVVLTAATAWFATRGVMKAFGLDDKVAKGYDSLFGGQIAASEKMMYGSMSSGSQGVYKRKLEKASYASGTQDLQKEFKSGLESVYTGKSDINLDDVERALSDNVLTAQEMRELLKAIRDNTKGEPRNPKLMRGGIY